MLNVYYKITLISLVLLLFAPFLAVAQIVPKLENVIVLDITPVNPGPEEQITISAESFSIDLDTSTISWFVNDVLAKQSIGETVFRFVTGGLGSVTTIDVVAETSGGSIETKQIIIRPTDIDLVWQAYTFTHPLYEGKSIASVGSSVGVEVIPHFINNAGRKLDASELIYSWRVDRKALPRSSGRGKNTITVSQSKPVSSLSVEVEVESPDKTLFGKRTILIPIRDSELLVYENNPLLGILFNNAIGNLYSLLGQETKFVAYPFFMSFINRNSSYINYSWKLNGNPITLGEDRGSITVSHTGENAGEAEISVSVQNSREIFQRSNTQFNVEFGRSSSSGLGF